MRTRTAKKVPSSLNGLLGSEPFEIALTPDTRKTVIIAVSILGGSIVVASAFKLLAN